MFHAVHRKSETCVRKKTSARLLPACRYGILCRLPLVFCYRICVIRDDFFPSQASEQPVNKKVNTETKTADSSKDVRAKA